MTRLFDAAQAKRDATEARRAREEVRRRAEEAEGAIKENLELDEASQKLGEKLAGARAVQPITYKAYRPSGSKWSIEHALVGEDYVFQLFPLRPPRLDWKTVCLLFANAMDAIFPRSVEIYYTPPSQRFELKYYTIRLEGVARLPGWKSAVEDRALRALAAVDAWPLAAAEER
jgi:hypothetical protein